MAGITYFVALPFDVADGYLDDVLRSQSVAKKLYWAINQLFM
jgi:hypothetical protein